MLQVTPWQAALGATISVPTLGGPVELKIPADSDAGRKLRLRGRGLPGTPPGDQIVEVEITAPVSYTHLDVYKRQVPSIVMIVPLGKRVVAWATERIAGMRTSRATMAAWDSRPPVSVTTPAARLNSGVQAGSVVRQTMMSPGWKRWKRCV